MSQIFLVSIKCDYTHLFLKKEFYGLNPRRRPFLLNEYWSRCLFIRIRSLSLIFARPPKAALWFAGLRGILNSVNFRLSYLARTIRWSFALFLSLV